MIIIDHPADITLLGDTVSKQALATLQNVDFGQFFVAAIYQGWKPYIDYEITVKNVTHLNDQVIIDASFIGPTPGMELHPITSSPYHVIKISREGIQGKVDFILKSDGQTVIEETHIFN